SQRAAERTFGTIHNGPAGSPARLSARLRRPKSAWSDGTRRYPTSRRPLVGTRRPSSPCSRFASEEGHEEAVVMTTAQEQGQLAAVSSAMVHLHKEQFGRGPTRARTNWAGNDVLICVLEDALLPAEQAMVEMDEAARVR